MDHRAVTLELPDAPQNELFVYIVGDVGQMVPTPAASSRKGVFLCRPLTEKGSKILWFGSWGRGHFTVQNICLFILLA